MTLQPHSRSRADALFRRSLQPAHTLALSAVVAALCSWTFLVIFFGWPRTWAMLTFLLTISVAPALPVACLFQIREHGFRWCLLAALLLSLIAMTMLALSFYFAIQTGRSN